MPVATEWIPVLARRAAGGRVLRGVPLRRRARHRARRRSRASAERRGLQAAPLARPVPVRLAVAMHAATYAKQIGRTVAVRARGVPPGVRRRARARRRHGPDRRGRVRDAPGRGAEGDRPALGARRARAGRRRSRSSAASATSPRSSSGPRSSTATRRSGPRPARPPRPRHEGEGRLPADRRTRQRRGRRHRRRRDGPAVGPPREPGAAASPAGCARSSTRSPPTRSSSAGRPSWGRTTSERYAAT